MAVPHTFKPEIINLDVVKHHVSMILDRELLLAGPRHFDLMMQELPHMMAKQLVATFRVPAQVLQDRKVIARYPANWKDAVKKELKRRWPHLFGWLTFREEEVRLTEHLVYPHVPLPSYHGDRVRLAVMPEFGSYAG